MSFSQWHKIIEALNFKKMNFEANYLAKIGQLENPIIADQQIPRLQIPMNDRIPVTGVHSRQNLDHPSLNLTDADSTIAPALSLLLGLRNHRRQIGPQKFQHQHGVLVLPPKVLVQNHHVRRVL